jgi:hypothetical protein
MLIFGNGMEGRLPGQELAHLAPCGGLGLWHGSAWVQSIASKLQHLGKFPNHISETSVRQFSVHRNLNNCTFCTGLIPGHMLMAH